MSVSSVVLFNYIDMVRYSQIASLFIDVLVELDFLIYGPCMLIIPAWKIDGIFNQNDSSCFHVG